MRVNIDNEQIEDRVGRWIGQGRYISPRDAGMALSWLLQKTDPQADQGVDYEQMAQSLLDGGHTASAFRELLIDRKSALEDVFMRAGQRYSGIGFECWCMHELSKIDADEIADRMDCGRDRVKRAVGEYDQELEACLKRAGLL